MKPWMIAALLGTLFGLNSRRWLSVDIGRGQNFDHNHDDAGARTIVTVIVGIGNTVNYNRLPRVSTLPSDKESSHAEGA
jgi:hypothetical protein